MNKIAIVHSQVETCKKCYSCIRECPARAIGVSGGQAVVIPERCIVCGHCVKVCSQHAKKIESFNSYVKELINSNCQPAAVIAPSFPAAYPENYNKIPSALRHLGFSPVVETSFGADMIANQYKKLLMGKNNFPIINSSCPAVVNFIQKYYPELVPNIAPIVSPMIAIGKYLKQNYGFDKKVVFIGPCVAKKDEFTDDEVNGVIDAVITFSELDELLNDKEIILNTLDEEEFDPPHAYTGKVFPLAGGLLRTANLEEDILEKEIIVVEGKNNVVEFIEAISQKKIESKIVDILFCEGCINGPAIDNNVNFYTRRQKVLEYINDKLSTVNKIQWKSDLYNSREINLTRTYSKVSQRRPMPSEEKINEILIRTNKHTEKEHLNCGACGYFTCREFAINVAKGLAEVQMCLPYLIDELQFAYKTLRETQEQLHTAEKLASIGELSAGVAHEINNPLGTIILYASLIKKQLERLESGTLVREDLELIIKEANRCKGIVANLLNFARQGVLHYSHFDLVKLITEIVEPIKLDTVFSNVRITINNNKEEYFINADPDQLKEVFSNIILNAVEAVKEKPNGKVFVSINENDGYSIISVEDNGYGIPEKNKSKIFTPFFTTKKIGKGTGLGLAISYGIIKMHRGEISFESETDKGTKFIVKLPITKNKEEEL